MSGIYTNCFDLWLGKDAAAHTVPDMDTDTIKVGIVDTGTDYTGGDANLTTDQDWADTGYATDTCYSSETTQTLGAITITAGVVDNTADITFAGVAIVGAQTVDAIVHYRSGGTDTTDALISFHNAFVGGAVTPNGGDIVIAYHGSGIFSL